MSDVKLRYELYPGSIGARLDIDALSELTADRRLMKDLGQVIDRRGVVHIHTDRPVRPEDLAVFEECFGHSATYGAAQKTVEGRAFLGDYTTPPKFDDGREPKPVNTDIIHIDTMPNGPAKLGVHATLSGHSNGPMRFRDMRAVYAALPPALKDKLIGLRARHTPQPRADRSPPPWSMHPFAAKHPRTGDGLLLMPNRRDKIVDGMSEEEGSALIKELWERAVDHAERLEIPLVPNTLIVWDNILCTHTNPGYGRAEGRVVWFYNIVNDLPIEAIAA